MKTHTTAFDPADYLDTPAAIAVYLEEAFASEDAAFIADALGVVARAHGMAKVAKSSGLGRESLYKALSSDGHPELATVMKVMRSLGLRLSPTTRPAAESVARK
jgi:probable addiction module antidote protein